MDLIALANELNKNVEILNMTFEKLNVQVLNYGFCKIENNGHMSFVIEVATLSNTELEDDVTIKVTLYDANNTIIDSDQGFIFVDDFLGYDTLTIHFYIDNVAFVAAKARVFATR